MDGIGKDLDGSPRDVVNAFVDPLVFDQLRGDPLEGLASGSKCVSPASAHAPAAVLAPCCNVSPVPAGQPPAASKDGGETGGDGGCSAVALCKIGVWPCKSARNR